MKLMGSARVLLVLAMTILGCLLNFLAVTYQFAPYEIILYPGLCLPLLLSRRLGWRTGLIGGLALFPLILLRADHGWGNGLSISIWLLWLVWHGKGKAPVRRNMYATEMPFRCVSFLLTLALLPPILGLNSMPQLIGLRTGALVGVAVGDLCNAYLALLLSDALLQFSFVRKLLWLPLDSSFRQGERVMFVTLFVGSTAWLVDAWLDHAFFYPDDTFLGILLLDIPAHELYFRSLFVVACVTVGVAISKQVRQRTRNEKELTQQREELRQAIDSSVAQIWQLDTDCRVLNINAVAERFLGKSLALAKGRTMEELLPGWDDPSARGKQCLRTVLECVPETSSLESICRKGEERWFEVDRVPVLDADGRAVGLTVFLHDSTEQLRIRQELRSREEKYRVLTDNLPDVVMRFDKRFRHLFANSAMTRLTGMEPEFVIGRTHRELGFPQGECQYWESSLCNVFESGNPHEQEIEFKAEEELISLDLRLIPELNERGDVESVLSVARDVTRRKRSERDYEMLFGSMLDGFALHEIVCDAGGSPVDYRFLAINPAFENLTGLKAEDLLGRTVLEVLPRTERRWIETYGRVALTGEGFTFENYAQELDKHFRVNTYQPKKGQFACVFHDITDQVKSREDEELERKREGFLNSILKLSLTDLPLDRKVEETLDKLFELPWLQLAGRGGMFLLDESLTRIETKITRGLGEVVNGPCSNFALSDCFCCRATVADLPEFCEKACETRGHCLIMPSFGYYRVPMEAKGKVLGTLVLYTCEGHVSDAAEKEFLSAVAHTLAGMVERKRTESRLRESEHRYRRLFEESNDAIFIHQGDVIIDVNERACGMLGYAREELVQASLVSLHPTEELTVCKKAVADVSSEGAVRFESRMMRKDGSLFSVDISARMVDEQAGLIQGIVRDVSDRKKAEDDLRENEKRYRSLLYAARSMSVVLSPSGVIEDFDRMAVQVTSYPAREAIGRDFVHFLIVPNDQQKIRDMLASVFQAQIKHNVECRIVIRGGFKREIVLNAVPRTDDTGKILGAYIAGRDVTELRIANRQRRASEARLQQVASHAPVVLFSHNTDGKLLYVTDNVERLAGVSSSALLGAKASWLDLVVREDRDEISQLWQKAMDNREGMECEYRIVHGVTGRTLWMQSRISVSSEGYGQQAFFGVTLDITQRKLMQAENEELADQLRQAEKMQALGQLAGGLSHDFNNLLAGITGAVELIHLKSDVHPDLERYYSVVMECLERASSLNQQLMAFARKGKFRSELIDMHAIVEDVVGILEHTIDKRIKIQRRLNASPPTTLGDPSQLQNALLNLSVNARDAMPEGGILCFETANGAPDDELAELKAEHYLRVSVSDTGAGIPEELYSKIFEPFFTTKPEGEGTGLGLSSVFGSVKAHQGVIKVESGGAGTTFHIYLPSVAPTTDTGQPEEIPQEPVRGQGRILIVDDERFVRQAVADHLSHLGYDVHEEADGQAGVDYFREHHRDIDLVILDMVMPRLNGRDSFFEMRRINPQAKVLLATGYAEDAAVQQILECGLLGVVMKPIRVAQLSAVVAESIHQGKPS